MSRLVTNTGKLLSSNTAKVLVAKAVPAASWFPGYTNDFLSNNLGSDSIAVTAVLDPIGNDTATVSTGPLLYRTNRINGLGAVFGDGLTTTLTLASGIVLTPPSTVLWIGVAAGGGKSNIPIGGAGFACILHYVNGDAYIIDDAGAPINSAVADAPTGPHWECFRVDAAGVIHYSSSTQTETALEGGTDLPGPITALYLFIRGAGDIRMDASIGQSELIVWAGIDIGTAGLAVNHANLQTVYGFP